MFGMLFGRRTNSSSKAMRREAHPGVLDLSSTSDLRDGSTSDNLPTIALSDEGSLVLRDLRLNALGGLTGIALGDLNLGPELGRGASSVVFLATYRCGLQSYRISSTFALRFVFFLSLAALNTVQFERFTTVTGRLPQQRSICGTSSSL
jgi:hypothetical protein